MNRPNNRVRLATTMPRDPRNNAEDGNSLMEWRPLRYFVVVAEELHFGRAAERLDIAQQSLGAQIQKLERTLGCQLFERGANRVALTAAGNVFLMRARRILAEIELAVGMTRRAAAGEAGTVRFGHCSAALRHVLPTTVRALKAWYPDLRITMREMRGSEQLRALERGEIDLSFTYLPVDRSFFSILVLDEERLVVGLQSAHRLTRLDSIELQRLVGEPYIALTKGLSAWADVITASLASGGAGQPAYDMHDKHSALGLVAEGLGFMILPEGAALPFPNVTFRRLSGLDRVPFAAVWLSEQSGSHLNERILAAVRSAAGGAASAG